MDLRADQLMREHAAKLLDAAGAIVVVLDADARISSCNHAMELLSGYALAEIRGKDWFDTFIPVDLRESLRTLFGRALGGEPVVGHVNPIVVRSGQLRQIEWHAHPVDDEHGRRIGVINVGLDVTDKLALQAKLVQSERLATVGMLAARFSHEVGNPLNAMYLQAQLLRRRIDQPNREQALGPGLDTILSEIQRLNSLLEDFRSFQRPQQQRLEPTDVGAVLSHTLDLLATRAAQSEITLTHEFAPALPRIQGNANKLKQVFINLCKNAIEAMPHGGSLRATTRRVDDRIVVDICDTGCGVPDGLDVFEPFVTTKPAGMGLGLALVREIVSAHAGEIHHARDASGTTFTISLPIPPSIA